MSIVLQGSTSGSVTLQEPAIAGTTVLNLPAVSGTVLTTGSSGQSIPKAALPTGSVLQVVQGTTTGSVTTTSASFASAGLSASITPTSSSSKILVTITGGDFDINVGGQQIYATIFRNSTNVITSGANLSITDVYTQTNRSIFPVILQYLDSPATTSSTTYTLYFYAGGASTVKYNTQGSTGVITLMEIAA